MKRSGLFFFCLLLLPPLSKSSAVEVQRDPKTDLFHTKISAFWILSKKVVYWHFNFEEPNTACTEKYWLLGL